MKKTVMVVDDEANIRLLYEKEFKDEGYDVILASDAREALSILEAKKPDVVVMDIKMPGMDGIEALGQVLARDRTLPVILNSAYSSYQDSFLSWSADAYVIKSSDLAPLKTQVKALIEKKARG